MTSRLISATALGALLAYFLVANVALSRPAQVNTADANADPVELATSTGASYNWSGYVADQGDYSAVSATWVVPQAQYPTGSTADIAADATWVGVGGVDSRDLIQAGTQALVDSSGATQYQAWYELLPDV
ncbi:MAG TPA: G1 family glutamic endopeptidase [Candidatus Paceibacterota bacterium]